MKKIYHPIFIVLIILLTAAISGCINLRTKHIERTRYALKLSCPARAAKKAGQVLEVSYPRISAQFDSQSFVYRTSSLNYTLDYYNVFFGSPAEQIQQNMIKYLQNTSLFNFIEANTYPIKPNYILKTYVKELYGDYRNSKCPRAVAAIRFVLFANDDGHKIILNKFFRQSILLKQKTSSALICAWSSALEIIFDNLAREIYTNTKPVSRGYSTDLNRF